MRGRQVGCEDTAVPVEACGVQTDRGTPDSHDDIAERRLQAEVIRKEPCFRHEGAW